MSEWMPIETAPKDGVRIIIWDGKITIIRADDLLARPVYLNNPTHWMPLPSPPLPEEKGK
jgi:hypothetical protein